MHTPYNLPINKMFSLYIVDATEKDTPPAKKKKSLEGKVEEETKEKEETKEEEEKTPLDEQVDTLDENDQSKEKVKSLSKGM